LEPQLLPSYAVNQSKDIWLSIEIFIPSTSSPDHQPAITIQHLVEMWSTQASPVSRLPMSMMPKTNESGLIPHCRQSLLIGRDRD